MDEYDAFLSYSSHDLAVVRRIQRFLESYRVGKPKRRVRVYLDRTDIRGGELGEELRSALARSARMVVCISPASIDSRWVAKEIAYFNELKGAKAIAQVLIAGEQGRSPFLPGAETRWHDLRRRALLRFSRPHVRLELLRLLAFITDVDLRTLRNWYLRRIVRNAAVALVALVAVSWYPISQWQPLTPGGRRPIYPIAAEVREGRIWAAARLRAAGPQGFRNYIGQTGDLLASDSSLSFKDREFASTRRLLPITLVARTALTGLPPFDIHAAAQETDGRAPVGQPFVGQTSAGRFIAVQPVSPTEDELDQARDNAADFSTPIPDSAGSLVMVFGGEASSVAYVPSLNPPLYPPKVLRDPLSPSHGLSVAWSSSGQIWIGVRGLDGQSVGGLWHSEDGGKTWRSIEGFASVSSILIEEDRGRTETVIVAESHLDLWRGISLEPYSSRVVTRVGTRDAWTEVSMPPFGTRSEIELCGKLNGASVVRIDEKLFVRRTVPLWAYVSAAL